MTDFTLSTKAVSQMTLEEKLEEFKKISTQILMKYQYGKAFNLAVIAATTSGGTRGYLLSMGKIYGIPTEAINRICDLFLWV